MRSPRLVLKRFDFLREDPSGRVLVVEGRAPGLTAFLLNLMKLDPTTSMVCYPDRVEVVSSSFSGRQSITIPSEKITAIQGGHQKPIVYLAIAAALCMMGGPSFLLGLVAPHAEPALGAGVLLLLLGLVFLVAFFIGKTMNLYVMNGGDAAYGLSFSQGVIEGVNVDAARVEQAVVLLTQVTNGASRGASANRFAA